MLKMCVCVSWQLFHMQRKKNILLSCAGIKKEYFSCKKIKVQEVCSLKWKKMGNILQPEAFMQNGVCSKLRLSYVEGLST